MNRFMNMLEETLMPLMNKVSTQRHLSAIRDGLIATIPLTIIGAITLLLATLPFPQVYVNFLENNPVLVDVLFVPFNMTIGILSIYISFGIGLRLAENYGLERLAGGISAVLTFFATVGTSYLEEGSYINMEYLGGQGIFTAIITSILAVEIMRLCKKNHITIKLPDSVPKNIGSSFDSLIPIIISVMIVSIIVHGFGFDINQVISTVITPFLSASSNSLLSPLIYVALSSFMWFFGIHPGVLAAIMSPVWTVNAAANLEAVTQGLAIPNIGVEPFLFTFVYIGGGGATLSLCFLMCLSKSEALKSLGRLSILPSIFNINEPIIFGLPLVLNPIMAIPLFVAPILCVITTYFAFTSGIVPGIGYAAAAVWNLPSPIAAALSTVSIQAAILVIINFIISGIVYYPFFKVYEKKYLLDEQKTK